MINRGLAITTAVLLFVLAFGGFLGGFALLADPTGAMVGFQDDMIDQLPVDSYTLPAVFLVIVFGMIPTYLGLHLSRTFFVPMSLKWQSIFVIALSCVLCVWISVQLWLIGWGHYMQTLTVIHAILLLGCGLAMYYLEPTSSED